MFASLITLLIESLTREKDRSQTLTLTRHVVFNWGAVTVSSTSSLTPWTRRPTIGNVRIYESDYVPY